MTPKHQDLYSTLGLTKQSTTEQVRAAYRRLAKSLHPDAGGDPAQFAQAKLANDVLSDPTRRARYDATGSVDHASIEQERAATLEILAGTVQQALAQSTNADPQHFDFLASCKALLNAKISEGERALSTHASNLSRLDAIISRVKIKKQKSSALPDPALLSILTGHRNAVSSAESQDKATCARFKKALELLADYKYDFVAPQPNKGYDAYANQQGSSFFTIRTGGI